MNAQVAFREFPYFPQFTFSSIAASTSNQVQLLIPHNIAVYGIAIQGSRDISAQFYNYRIQFLDYESGNTLFDEPIQANNLQCNATGYIPKPDGGQISTGGAWVLPSKWFLRKNQKIICKLNTFASSQTTSYYVTLLAYTTDFDPNPGIQPTVYSYPMRIGFQDATSGAGGQTSVNFNQQITNTLAKPMVHDFELHSITLDPFGTTGMDGTYAGIPHFSFQISWPGKKLFDRMVINGVAGGGALFSQDGNVFLNSGGVFRFPAPNIIQYSLSRPIRICKGTMVRVDISPAPTYLASSDIHNAFNEEVCMALIGNHYA